MEETVVDIGDILRERREKLGFSLSTVAQRICIRETYLESLENNQFENLPGKAYVLGFVRSYALCLGLDDNELILQLDHEKLNEWPSSKKFTPFAMQQAKGSSPSVAGERLRNIGLVVLSLLILAGAIYALLPLLQPESSVGDGPKQAVNEQKQAVNEQKQAVNEQKQAVEPIQKENGDDASKPTVTVAAPEKKVIPAAETTAIEKAESTLLPSIPIKGSSLRMLAVSESSLVILIDERKSHQYKLHDGLDLTWKIKQRVKVELPETGVARFWLDGKELELDHLKSFKLEPAKKE